MWYPSIAVVLALTAIVVSEVWFSDVQLVSRFKSWQTAFAGLIGFWAVAFSVYETGNQERALAERERAVQSRAAVLALNWHVEQLGHRATDLHVLVDKHTGDASGAISCDLSLNTDVYQSSRDQGFSFLYSNINLIEPEAATSLVNSDWALRVADKYAMKFIDSECSSIELIDTVADYLRLFSTHSAALKRNSDYSHNYIEWANRSESLK